MFGGGGGGLDSRKMQQMMKQMGIDIDELDAEEVIIKTSDETLVFDSPDVQRMDAQGQETYNVVGSPRTEAAGELTDEGDADEGDDEIPQEDIETVADRAGASESEAKEALEATGGMPLDAIERLSE